MTRSKQIPIIAAIAGIAWVRFVSEETVSTDEMIRAAIIGGAAYLVWKSI
ncbi:hypothetical protein RHODOSMS8_00964 [Rhodobiaceae bacterium]|nr:hypothetical protein RHODOSMS8_00964 [Rhodobiaceae bacterium]